MHLTSHWVFYHEQIISQDIKSKMAATKIPDNKSVIIEKW